MNTVGTKPPGWYTDPVDPALIRYWEGDHWSERVRERPSWAPPLDDEEAARSHAARLRRRKWWARGVGSLTVGVLLVATLFAVRSDVPHIPARSVADTAFTSEANRVCAAAMPGIREEPPQVGSADRPAADEALARRVEHTADGLAGLVASLRALPVAAADRAEVDGWLAQWDRFVDVGRRYAEALRGGDTEEFQAVAAEGDEPSRAIYVFARANGMPECVFRS